jgi:hypothetical protein
MEGKAVFPSEIHGFRFIEAVLAFLTTLSREADL